MSGFWEESPTELWDLYLIWMNLKWTIVLMKEEKLNLKFRMLPDGIFFLPRLLSSSASKCKFLIISSCNCHLIILFQLFSSSIWLFWNLVLKSPKHSSLAALGSHLEGKSSHFCGGGSVPWCCHTFFICTISPPPSRMPFQTPVPYSFIFLLGFTILQLKLHIAQHTSAASRVWADRGQQPLQNNWEVEKGGRYCLPLKCFQTFGLCRYF